MRVCSMLVCEQYFFRCMFRWVRSLCLSCVVVVHYVEESRCLNAHFFKRGCHGTTSTHPVSGSVAASGGFLSFEAYGRARFTSRGGTGLLWLAVAWWPGSALYGHWSMLCFFGLSGWQAADFHLSSAG